MSTTTSYNHLPEKRRSNFSPSRFVTYALSSDSISLIRDVAFSVTTASITWDIRSPVSHLPVFLVFAVISFFFNISSLLAFNYSIKAFILPLFVFSCIHLISAFDVGSTFHTGQSNGLKFFLQFCAVTAFVWPFVVRYSQISMSRYLFLTGIMLLATLVFVLGYHIAHHKIVSWKLLARGKSTFDLLPIVLLVMSRSKKSISKTLYPLLLPAFLIIIMLSGERKAYIIAVLLAPLLINFKNPLVYLAPLFGAALFVVTKYLQGKQGHGYVERQISTLMGLAHGQVVQTNSNTERLFAVKLAFKMFKEHPLFGSGTNSYNLLVERVYSSSLGVHNEWLRVAAENGAIGLFFYISTVLYGLVGLFRTRVWGYTRSREDKLFGYALFVTCFMYLSFEAFAYEVLIAFCMIPLIQFLRFSPSEPRLRS